ncbi:MAG: dihydroneopterin aldolase, partial [Candidatus Omnitrophica bacterium]|nr:dihydroneopterin aldolase [Candidatus Omnitrophota bacterium]
AESGAFHLMETLAEQVAALLLKETGCREVTVRVTKRALPNVESAAVDITRPPR